MELLSRAILFAVLSALVTAALLIAAFFAALVGIGNGQIVAMMFAVALMLLIGLTCESSTREIHVYMKHMHSRVLNGLLLGFIRPLGARSEVHLRLHDERDELRLFRRDPRLPDLGSFAAMDDVVWPITVEPAGAEATKLVLLSIVAVPLASAGRLIKAAAAPSVSAKLMIAPPWAIPPIVQRSGRISIRAARASASALMNSIPSNWANGSGLALMRSISDMRLP